MAQNGLGGMEEEGFELMRYRLEEKTPKVEFWLCLKGELSSISTPFIKTFSLV